MAEIILPKWTKSIKKIKVAKKLKSNLPQALW